MIKNILKKVLTFLALKHNRATSLYTRVCRPDGTEWAIYLKKFGRLHAMGEGCYVQTDVTITDPAYTRLGNNVFLTGCRLLGHDASVLLVKRIYNIQGDNVGKIDIRDNVWVGVNATVMPGVTIGPNAIVGAGSLVIRDVAPGTIVGGVPAKCIGYMDDLAAKTTARFQKLPWRDHAQMQPGAQSIPVSPSLDAARVKYFFPEDQQ